MDSLTSDYVGEHISKIKAAIKRYNISSPKIIFNIDKSAMCSNKIIAIKKELLSRAKAGKNYSNIGPYC